MLKHTSFLLQAQQLQCLWAFLVGNVLQAPCQSHVHPSFVHPSMSLAFVSETQCSLALACKPDCCPPGFVQHSCLTAPPPINLSLLWAAFSLQPTPQVRLQTSTASLLPSPVVPGTSWHCAHCCSPSCYGFSRHFVSPTCKTLFWAYLRWEWHLVFQEALGEALWKVLGREGTWHLLLLPFL